MIEVLEAIWIVNSLLITLFLVKLNMGVSVDVNNKDEE